MQNKMTSKRQLMRLLLLATMLLIFYACRKEFNMTNDVKSSLSIEEAKSYMSKQKSIILSADKITFSTFTNAGEKLNYAWDKAITTSRDSVAIVEIPLMDKKKGYVIGADNPDYADASITRLVIIKNAHGEMRSFLMTIVPDIKYLQEKPDDVVKNTYLTKTSRFTGLVVYHHEEGSFISGNRYVNGQNLGKLVPVNDKNIQGDSQQKIMIKPVAGQDCTYYTMYDYSAVCYVQGSLYVCEWEASIRWSYSVCTDGTGDGGGTSNGQVPVDTLNKIADSCLKVAMQMALANGVKNDFKNIMDSTFLGNKNIILVFQEENIGDTTVLGRFIPWITKRRNTGEEYEIAAISFNTQTTPGISQEMKVWTLYHELLHAYISKMGQLLYPNYNHQYIANTYVNKLSAALQGLFPGMSGTDAQALAWVGLDGTPMWSLVDPYMKPQYIAIANEYKKGRLGHKCQ
jgi:hypothetical protein